ncbi:MAG TPA: response regulator [Verrucomicrobiae bacterium]|nr:response regulator [Verrucomicrobiae bacterium]
MKRILVIEDDAAVRGLIVETLQIRGWQPLQAADGQQGLDLAVSELPDLVLCDIQMPKLDGYEVLRGIRENTITSTLPFLFLTGLGDKPKMRQAMELGADDYIVKPFTVQELLGAVDARFQKQAALEENADRKLHDLRESLSFALPHELVTPLNAILGFAGLLLESKNLNREDIHEYASHIKTSGERLRVLIEKFLVYGQIELAAADPEQRNSLAGRPASPTNEAVAVTAQRVSEQFNRRSDLIMEICNCNHRISASHLERGVWELLENALKFSAPGSPVLVATSCSAGKFEICVKDRGRGFAPGQIKRIGANRQFDRKTVEQQGSGLGLAICRRLAELYGGSLEIQSPPGGETSVAIHLPE